MDRLQTEFHRLYLPDPAASGDTNTAPRLIGPHGEVRALVLELGRPAQWAPMARVWEGVQSELGWPAPAIAVTGVDAYQLWFSLAEPVAVAQAEQCLASLRWCYLNEVAPERIGSYPSLSQAAPEASTAAQALHAHEVPAQQPGTERWSAFLSRDLATLFAEEPWLDLPPGAEAQAELLAGLGSVSAADFHRGLQTLLARQQAAEGMRGGAAAAPHGRPPSPAQGQAGSPAERPALWPMLPGGYVDPQLFLRDVMNHPEVALAQRIEAAKALLLHTTPASR